MNRITRAALGVSVTGYVHQARTEAEKGTTAAKLAATVDAFVPVILEFDEAARGVEGDIKLSPIGRGEKIIALFIAFRARLGITEFDKQVGSAETELDLLKKVDPPKVDDPHAGDIRAHVKSLRRSQHAIESSEQREFLNERAGDPQVVSAILSAPAYLSGLSDSEFSRFQRAALARFHPERGKRIELLEATIAGAQRARGNAERMLTNRAGVRWDDARQRWVHEISGAFGPAVSR